MHDRGPHPARAARTGRQPEAGRGERRHRGRGPRRRSSSSTRACASRSSRRTAASTASSTSTSTAATCATSRSWRRRSAPPTRSSCCPPWPEAARATRLVTATQEPLSGTEVDRAAAARPRRQRAPRRPLPVHRGRHRLHAAGRGPQRLPQPQRAALRQAGVHEPDRLRQGPRRQVPHRGPRALAAGCGRTPSSSSPPAATPASRWP